MVVGTHADLLPFMRSVGELDLRKVLQKVFPAGRGVRATQVIVHGSLRLETSGDAKEPVWSRGPAPGATELLESAATELGVAADLDRPLYEPDVDVPGSRLPVHALLPSLNGAVTKTADEPGGAS
jgi:hypothetical protein